MTQDWETLVPLLVYMQANLSGDLTLAALSRKVGLSPFHLQRTFKAAVGETPKAYVARLRVERAAFQLLLHDASLFQIALDCGFQNHETFIRAFRRRYGKAPSAYRQWVRQQLALRAETTPQPLATACPRFALSATRVVRLQPLHLAFLRHVGPYELVPDTIFHELERWAAQQQIPGPPLWMGIGHDSPSITPPDRLRFDAALVVPGPFAPRGRIAHQFLEGGDFAVTTHAGAYDTLPEAYAAIFPAAAALRGFRLLGLPAIEIYHTVQVNPQYHLNSTDICLPVVRSV